ncbi:hypothetical protein, variant 1 [Aphanomyces astaci]|uniref:Uncharacterized protein n=1 Tax=Aphanomyces astaci TaxID=112090 RepID=W4G588_APHAT|nr:hypothetical protein, variant 1 [Aphanomyces astaci]ETV74887.1 hypothetical protein, variant 1 [Aphanomyces astaci]|eukprot:XP_009835390.1 hypothetical protein, variant 1 [Aphanomyces astaci]
MSSPSTSPSGLRRPTSASAKPKASGVPSPIKPTSVGRSPPKQLSSPFPEPSPFKKSSLISPVIPDFSSSAGGIPPPSPSKALSSIDCGKPKRGAVAPISPTGKQPMAKSPLKKVAAATVPSPKASKNLPTPIKKLTPGSPKSSTSRSTVDLELALRQKDDVIASITDQCSAYREEAESSANLMLAWKANHDAVVTLLEESMEALAMQTKAINGKGMVNEDNRDHLTVRQNLMTLVTFDKQLLEEKFGVMHTSEDESASQLCKGKIHQLQEKLAAKQQQQSQSAQQLEGVGVSLPRGVLQHKASTFNQIHRPFATSFGDEVHLDDVSNAWQWLSQHVSYKNSS